MNTGLLTVVTLVAFAANSVLCRMALKAELIDPVTFTEIRMLSGALFLAPFFYMRRSAVLPLRARDWFPAGALFLYAVAFSFAYVSLSAAAGALILFGVVQITMISVGVAKGARPMPLQWLGVVIAFGGLSYLLAPGLSAPPLKGAALMALAGLGWGVYSLMGKGETDPVAGTARNFLLAAPLSFALLLWPGETHAELGGVALAVASGALASGAGYVIWYAALKGLTTMSASVVQLAVPAIAALGGILFLSEAMTPRLAIASILILGGIFLAVRQSAGAKTKDTRSSGGAS